ncbi:hypothetical protein [Pseudonocardia oceani]|uniref:hypothetical protein n=1 Tax=Pseudonocardia oceani TaxID=2792013 RepID=UPI001C4A6D83|nr:hypothetical protein [Pseudonocardia oceani]
MSSTCAAPTADEMRFVLDELPRSSSGKIQKFRLRVEYAQLYAGAPGVVAPASSVATP